MKLWRNLKKITKRFRNKSNFFLYRRFKKYVIDYKIEDKNLRIYTNLGDSRIVKNTKTNQKKLNRIIVRNKLEIAKQIDEFENTSEERFIVLIINALLLGISGALVPLTFFIGNYIVFLSSIFLFSFLTLAVSIITIDYYILIEEIKSLKNITGYKKDRCLSSPKVKIKTLKIK